VRPMAEHGSAVNQFLVGLMYATGEGGVPRDYAAAESWLRKAADQGHANAQVSLCTMYFNGGGVPQNYAAAMDWCRKAADQGDADAQTTLGFMYDEGQSVPMDHVAAVSWYRKAADQGNVRA